MTSTLCLVRAEELDAASLGPPSATSKTSGLSARHTQHDGIAFVHAPATQSVRTQIPTKQALLYALENNRQLVLDRGGT